MGRGPAARRDPIYRFCALLQCSAADDASDATMM